MNEKKNRIPIPDSLAAQVIFEHDRTCCVCNVRGRATQIHHIDDNPSNNDRENLALLCLEDHNDTQVRGGFGRKLNPDIVRKYREDWVQRVNDRRAAADRVATEAYHKAEAQNSEHQPSRIEILGGTRMALVFVWKSWVTALFQARGAKRLSLLPSGEGSGMRGAEHSTGS